MGVSGVGVYLRISRGEEALVDVFVCRVGHH